MPTTSNHGAVVAELRGLEASLAGRVTMALDATGYEMVDLARSVTSSMRPPVRRGEGPRASHPGGWADVTGGTAASIRHAVEQRSAAVFRLTLEAGGAAPYLERRGYWVLSGLFYGPVNESLRRNFDAAFAGL